MAATRATDQYVTLNNLRFHYREWGDASDRLLVILHGLNSHSWDWDFLAAALCDQYHVVVPDQRGHGESDWAEDYTWQRLTEDVDALVAALGVAEFTLLGYSVGGGVAYAYAGTHRGKLERLIVVDHSPAPNFRPRSPELQSMLLRLQIEPIFDNPEGAIDIWSHYDTMADREAIRETVMHNVKQLPDGRWTWRDDPHSRSGVNARGPTGSYLPAPEERWQLVSQINCSTLLIYGTESEQNHAAAMERMATLISDCCIVPIEATHRVHWDNRPALTTAVRDFLAR